MVNMQCGNIASRTNGAACIYMYRIPMYQTYLHIYTYRQFRFHHKCGARWARSITLFYHVNGVSLSVYETHSLPAKLSDTKRRVLELVCSSLTLEVWLTIMKNLAEALHFIHRDLKSDNVVLNKQGEKIICVLVDFGKSNYVTCVQKCNLSEEENDKYRQDQKHIPPDNIVDGLSNISTASDMYSFGRLLKNMIFFYLLFIIYFYSFMFWFDLFTN